MHSCATVAAVLALSSCGGAASRGSEPPTTLPAATAPSAPTPAAVAEAAAVEPAPPPIEVPDYAGGTEQITASAGSSFGIVVNSNLTTPFRWEARVTDGKEQVLFVDESYAATPPPGCKPCAGYGGVQRFLFRALAPGAATVKLSLIAAGASHHVEKEIATTIAVTAAK